MERVALVTGGMGGLGEAVCTKMAEAGYQVLTTYSPGNVRWHEWLNEMKNRGYDFHAVYCDVMDYDCCKQAVAEALEQFGRIDVLVNNAGITRDMTFKKMDKLNWDMVINTNLNSLFNVTKPVLDGMMERSWGRIINISSINGWKGQFGQTNYSAAKAGVHGFTKALAQEVARKGITVNTVSPGYLQTKMVEAVPKDVLESKIISQIPVGRLGKPEEVASLILFLSSDDAGYLTGANISINGGQYMH